MHISFICHEYPPAKHGGVGSFTQTLARKLVKTGLSVTVVGLYRQESETRESDEGVAVVRQPLGKMPGLRIAENYLRIQKALKEIHRNQRIDLLEGAERSFFLVSPRHPYPKVIRMHGGYVYFRKELKEELRWQLVQEEKRSFRVATHVCAVSSYVAEQTRGYLKLGSMPIPVILNPVDLEVFHPQGGEAEEGLIVYVGTVIEKKGVRQLVQAMPRVVEACPSARLVIYGNDSVDAETGGSYTERLRKLVPGQLAGRVEFAGPVGRHLIPGLLAKASVCVYPSHMEALPIAWVEGLAMGRAVLGARTGPGPEVIEDGVSGLLCDPHDPHSIAEGLIQLLQDGELRQRLGLAARKRAEERFSLASLISQNIAYYEQCVAGWRSGGGRNGG